MATKTATADTLSLPIYAEKPQRRIAGTTAVAVTMYRSHDGSVRTFAVIDSATGGHLGTAHYQSGRRSGYAMTACPGLADEVFPTLAAYAAEIARRNDIDVVVGH